MERSCDRPIGSFRAGDDPHNANGLVTHSYHPAFERCRVRNNLDFKDLITFR